MHPSGNRHDAADFALVLTVIFLRISNLKVEFNSKTFEDIFVNI
jgi:hypothetical protein